MNKREMTQADTGRFTGSVIVVDTGEEHRCTHCSRLLFKGDLGEKTCIELKCPRCKELIKIAAL